MGGRHGRAGDAPLDRASPAAGVWTRAVTSARLDRLHQVDGAAWIALGRLRAHLVQADDYAAGRCRGVELLDRPLLRAKSGSTRSPNQVSSRRHLGASRVRISPIRL